MDVSLVLNYILAGAVTLLVGAVGWLIKTVITTSRRVEVLESREHPKALRTDITDIQSRMAVLESREQSEAIRTEIGDVHKRVDEVASTMHNMNGQMTQFNRTLSLLESHLINTPGE